MWLVFIIGMLSKSKGQILRVAATMHVLFHWQKPHDISTIIDEKAVSAAIEFVDLCIQHAAFITGRKTIEEEIEVVHSLMQGMQDKITSNIIFLISIFDVSG